jgi:hypothetical protein
MHFPTADWGVAIDPSFVKQAISKKIIEAAKNVSSLVKVRGVNVFFETFPLPDGGRDNSVWVYAPADVDSQWHCNVPASIRADISPKICRNASGRSALVGCVVKTVEPHLNACIVIESLIFGVAKAKVCTPGPCPKPPPEDPCPQMNELQFDVGPGDTFYASGLETDENAFYIAGRSTFLDGILPSRPAVAACQ